MAFLNYPPSGVFSPHHLSDLLPRYLSGVKIPYCSLFFVGLTEMMRILATAINSVIVKYNHRLVLAVMATSFTVRTQLGTLQTAFFL